MRFLDRNHPLFQRAWARWATVLVPLAWGVIEALGGNPGWAVVFAAGGFYAAWELILRAPDDPGSPPPAP